MIAIRATYRNGRIEPAEPLNFHEGAELEIEVREKDEPPTQAEIDRVLAAMDQIIPFDRSPEEEARLEADRLERKAWEKSQFFIRADKIDEMWK
jgi:predicted DNA-binding antitoxin AbrB/MazE fold protein